MQPNNSEKLIETFKEVPEIQKKIAEDPNLARFNIVKYVEEYNSVMKTKYIE